MSSYVPQPKYMLTSYLLTHTRVHRWPAHRPDVGELSEVDCFLQMEQGEIVVGCEEAKEHIERMFQFPGKQRLLTEGRVLRLLSDGVTPDFSGVCV